MLIEGHHLAVWISDIKILRVDAQAFHLNPCTWVLITIRLVVGRVTHHHFRICGYKLKFNVKKRASIKHRVLLGKADDAEIIKSINAM